ncbi:signal peptide, CUB and EGF-like domain-containing protein 2 [Haliotis asinina]|uniref:signal peptide, CUB and EGF-like domain-containing protein 2 n=1 Tax=Haliotis asinina TaxID=109174 RepID=UPI003531CB61
MLLIPVCILPLMVAASFAVEPSQIKGMAKRGAHDPCSTPTIPNGRAACTNYWNEYDVSTICSVTCDHGYKSNGGYIGCSYGRLSVTVSCIEIRCPSPPSVSNGVIHCGTSTVHKLDDACNLQCNAGYKLGSSSSEVKCLSDETWSSPPVCVENSCPPPPTLSHGRYNCTDAPKSIGTVCGLQCDSGYKLGTGVTAVTCLDDETWTAVGSCTEAKCLVPVVTNGHLDCSTTSVRSGTSCGLTCGSGYTPTFGIRDRICQSDETWSNPVTCVDTSPPVIINCPSSQTHFLNSNQAKLNITWPEVKAVDSPKGNLVNVTLTSTLKPGSAYPAGNYTVQYDAKDDTGNKAYPCFFTVSITICPSGSYIKVSNSKLECVPCPTGTYQEHEGRFSCVPCPTGMTTTSDGSDSSSSCKGSCDSGSYSINGVVPCSPCPIGSYQDRPGSKQCDACPVGRVTKTQGGKGPEDCICPRGFFVMDILLSKTCTACPKGTYQDQEDSHKCVYCAWGLSTSTAGSVSKTDCRAPCLPGTSSSDGLQPCTPCPKGSYQSSPEKTNCDLCPKGHTTNATGALKPTDCTVVSV